MSLCTKAWFWCSSAGHHKLCDTLLCSFPSYLLLGDQILDWRYLPSQIQAATSRERGGSTAVGMCQSTSSRSAGSRLELLHAFFYAIPCHGTKPRNRTSRRLHPQPHALPCLHKLMMRQFHLERPCHLESVHLLSAPPHTTLW